MQDSSITAFACEPLDWILFNKILQRQMSSGPKSHGNYNPSLLKVESLIDELIAASGSDPDDVEDLPAFSVLFLSDGKPSDRSPLDIWERTEILRRICTKLQSNLTFTAIGLGASGSDFSTLNNMAETVNYLGSNGSFSFAELSSAALTTAISSASTSLTATRTAKMGTGVDAAADEDNKRNIKLRSSSVPKAERNFKTVSSKVTRWRFDKEKYKLKDD